MKMRLRLGAALLLALAWIVGNAPMAFADGAGSTGLMLAGYAVFGGGILAGYLLMLWGIPKRLTHLIFGSFAKKRR